MQRTDERTVKSVMRELEDVIFTEADARWVQHPYSDALVITTSVGNNNVHKMLIDNGSVMGIIYLDT